MQNYKVYSSSSEEEEENQHFNNYVNFRNEMFTPKIESRKIIVSSSDITSSTNDYDTSNYIIHFNNNNNTNLDVGYGNFKNVIGFRLLECGITVSPNNISNKNNVIKFKENDNNNILTLTLDIGSYDNNDIALEFKTKLNDVSSDNDYDVNFNNTTNKFNITKSSGNFKFLWLSSNNLAYRLFGFNKFDQTSFSTDITSDNPSDHSNRFIDLVIPEIPYKSCIYNSNGKHIIERIPLNEVSGDMVHYAPEHCISNNYFYPINIHQLNIQLHSEFNNIFYDTQNYDNYFSFEITILRNLDMMN